MDNAGLYKELIECSDNIVLVTDSSFKIRYISSAVQKTFEIPPNKLVGRDVFEFVDADKIQLWKDCLEERQQNLKDEISLTVAHGRKAYFDVQVAKLNIETLEQGLAVHLHEITDKKIKEHQLKGSNEQMDQVIYKTTHDLKAPIVSALALTTLAEEAVVEDKNKYIELIRRSLVKLDTFINEMNSFFRSEKLALRRELIDFDMLIKDELENLNSALLNSRVQISVEKKGSGDFYSDSIRVKTILTNLLSNAIKYSDLKKRVPFIRILVLINEEFCELCVVDNGIGIEPQYQDKIFDLFFRATDQSQGTGLGLFIVRDTVQKLKGTIHVVSTLGEGSTFKVRIPNQIYQPIEVV